MAKTGALRYDLGVKIGGFASTSNIFQPLPPLDTPSFTSLQVLSLVGAMRLSPSLRPREVQRETSGLSGDKPKVGGDGDGDRPNRVT